MDHFDIDVIIATHTPDRPVQRAVHSVLAHTRCKVRVTVVVHNTDPDPIKRTLRAYHDDPRLRVVTHKDGVPSPSGPMNHGYSLVTAAYSSLIGSDDELAPGVLDYWLELAKKHQAGAVIARLDLADGPISPQPPVRPRYRAVRDPVKDRLAYRSAPLGLISTEHFGALRLTEGLRAGVDIAYSLRVWFSGHPIVFAEQQPGYLVHTDRDDRVTTTSRAAKYDLACIYDAIDSEWFRAFSRKVREAITVKLLRVQLCTLVGRHLEEGMTEENRFELAAARAQLGRASGTAERYLARTERELLDVLDGTVGSTQHAGVLSAWRKRASLAGILPKNPLWALHRQAPLRYGVASILLARRGK